MQVISDKRVRGSLPVVRRFRTLRILGRLCVEMRGFALLTAYIFYVKLSRIV